MVKEPYIKVMVEGLAGGRAWVFKPKEGNGCLVKTPTEATRFTEMEAFDMRMKVIAQLPKEARVTFDLKERR